MSVASPRYGALDVDTRIQHFPPEVVERILREHILEKGSAWLSVARRRKVVCGVSPAWKDIVYATSAYWRHVPIHLYLKPSWVQFALERAKSGPLTLEINVQTWTFPYPGYRSHFRRDRCMTLSRFLTTSLPLLREVYSRVVSIRIYADTDSDIVAVMGVLSQYDGSAILHATLFSHSSCPPDVAFATDVMAIPLLSRLLLRRTRPAFGLSLFRSLHTLQITQLFSEAKCTTASLLDVLRSCVVLRELELNQVVCFGEYNGPLVVLPSVRRFRLDYGDVGIHAGVEVMRWVRLPFLQELCITSRDKNAYIYNLTNNADHLFADAVHVDICANVDMRRLVHTIALMRNARTLDLRGAAIGPDVFSRAVNFQVAFQSTRLHTIRLPLHVPLDIMRSMLDFIDSGVVATDIRVETGNKKKNNARWVLVDSTLICTPLELAADARWMNASDASPEEFRDTSGILL